MSAASPSRSLPGAVLRTGGYVAAAAVLAAMSPLWRHRPHPVHAAAVVGRDARSSLLARFPLLATPAPRSNADVAVAAATAALDVYWDRCTRRRG